MPVYITDVKISDDYTGLISGSGSDIGLNKLKACIGDLMYAKIDFNVAWNTVGVPMTFSASAKTITRNDCGIIIGSFISDGYKAGDSIVIINTDNNDATYTVAKVTNTVLTVSETITDEAASSPTVYGATSINYFDFYYNLINNDNENSFVSLLDNKTLQRYTGDSSGSYYGNTSALQPNAINLSWYVNSVDGNSCNPVLEALGTSATYQQQFQLIFPFLVTPLFLAEQLTPLKNALIQSRASGVNVNNFEAPDLFPLKFIYKIDAKFSLNETAPAHTSDIVTVAGFGLLSTTFIGDIKTNPPIEKGNTAWFNTFFPDGTEFNSAILTTPQYFFTSINYDDGNGNSLTELDVNNPTHVVLKVHISDTITTDMPYVLNFTWLPTKRGAYGGYSPENQQYFRKVFLHDRAKTEVGAASADGDMFGTSTQAITDLTTSVVSEYGSIDVLFDFTIDFGSFSKSTLQASTVNDRNYALWVTPQNPNVTTLGESQRGAVLGDVNNAIVNTDDPDIFAITTDVDGNILFYNPSALSATKTDVKDAIAGYDYGKAIFKVQEGCNVQSINVTIDTVVYDADSKEVGRFNLQTWNKNTGVFYDGNITQIAIQEDDVFNLEAGLSWNKRKIVRRPDLDTGGFYYCELDYIFQIGFDYFQSVINYGAFFANYATQYWPAYTQNAIADVVNNILPSGYTSKIIFGIKWTILNTQTNVITQFLHNAEIEANDSEGVANISEIKFYDFEGNEIEQNIYADAPMTVIVESTGTFVLGDASLTLTYQVGNRSVVDRIDTKDADPETSTSVWRTIGADLNVALTALTIVGVFDFSSFTEPISNIKLIATYN